MRLDLLGVDRRVEQEVDQGVAALAVRRLRRSGEIVVQVLPGHEQDQDEFVCDRELALQDGVWTVRTL